MVSDSSSLEGNSSYTPLASTATFVGDWSLADWAAGISVFVKADTAGTLYLDHSVDGVTVGRTSTWPVSANNDFEIGFSPKARFWRIRYANGAVAQTTFALQSIRRAQSPSGTFTQLSSALGDSNIAMLVRSVINAKDPATGKYTNLALDADGGLKVHVQNPASGGAGVDPVGIKDGTNATQKLAVDTNGRIGINNFPATQPVSGTVAVSNLPATQPVSGTVAVSNLTPAVETGLAKNTTLTDGTQKTQVTNFPATQPVSGTVSIGNFPATQPVSLATNTPDVTDRGARLLGHVTVDNAALPVTGTFWQATQPVSGPLTDAQLRATRVPVDGSGVTQPVSGTFWQATQPVSGTVTASQGGAPWTVNLTQIGGAALTLGQKTMAASMPVSLASDQSPVTITGPAVTPANLAVTATGAAAAAVTLTLPAAGAGLFHYLNSLEITLYSTAARTGVAAPIVVTSTNLPGALAWTFATAAAIGTTDRYMPTATEPLKSSAANTATTIVCPAVTGGIWRVTVTYFAGT